MLAQDRGSTNSPVHKRGGSKAKPKGITKGMAPSRKVRRSREKEANMHIQEEYQQKSIHGDEELPNEKSNLKSGEQLGDLKIEDLKYNLDKQMEKLD